MVLEHPTQRAHAPPSPFAAGAILQNGRNCWRIDTAGRAAVIVDGARYFAVLRDAFERAQRSILIVAWDFDGKVVLDPLGTGPASRPLREYLPDLLARRPGLTVRILVWGLSMFYGESQSLPPFLDRRWPRHPRLRFRFAWDHPLLACHHQKIVCVDDAFAICGGMDLTAGRWDVPTHDAGHPLRVDARGKPYPPKHDVLLAVDGRAAHALGKLARGRWEDVTEEHLPPQSAAGDPWPDGLAASFRGVRVGIARTCASAHGTIREAETLTRDALAAARDYVYLESQYLTSHKIGEHVAELLARPRGPDIVAVVRRRTAGVIQRFAMGSNRTRLLRKLAAADRHHRLRVYYPVVRGADGKDVEVYVHSKMIAVDDRFLRVGSSNLNNRSMGYDSECDLALEAHDAPSRAAVRATVCGLVGEHLGRSPADVQACLAQGRGLIETVERLGTRPARRLVPYDMDPRSGPQNPIPGTQFLDRDEPFHAAWPFSLLGRRRAR